VGFFIWEKCIIFVKNIIMEKMKHCEDCGNLIGVHGCEWCNEESYIYDQYIEQDMELPDDNSDFMEKVRKQQIKYNQ
jgi:hypothetical protein